MLPIQRTFFNKRWRAELAKCAKKRKDCGDSSPESLKECDTVIIKGIVDYHGEQVNNWLIP